MNIYILEDNRIQQIHYEKLIHDIAKEHDLPAIHIYSFSKPEDLLHHLPSPSIDNVFLLDLELGDDRQAGLKLSQEIRKGDLFATIIFITVHDELLPVTYRYQSEALDFIAKDHDDIKDKLTADLLSVSHKLRRFATPTITLKVTGGVLRISINDILYFESNPANSHQSFLHTTNNQVTTINANLKQIDMLADHFFRIHRRYVVNLRKFKQVDTHHHLLSLIGTNTPLPLSRLKNKALLTKLAELNRQDQQQA